PVEDWALTRRQKAAEADPVRVALRWRNDRLGQRLPQDLRPGPPEHGFRLVIPVGDATVGIHGDEGIVAAFNDRSRPFLGLPERSVGAFAFDDAAELGADVGEA